MLRTHGTGGAVNARKAGCQTEFGGGGGSVSPPGIRSRQVHADHGLSPLAFTEEKVNKMVARIEVT